MRFKDDQVIMNSIHPNPFFHYRNGWLVSIFCYIKPDWNLSDEIN